MFKLFDGSLFLIIGGICTLLVLCKFLAAVRQPALEWQERVAPSCMERTLWTKWQWSCENFGQMLNYEHCIETNMTVDRNRFELEMFQMKINAVATILRGTENQFFCAICVSHWKSLIHELYITWQSHLPPMRAGTTNATGWPLGLEAAKARDCPKPESIVARFGEGMKSTSTRKTYSAHCVIWVDGQIQILFQITCNSKFYIKTSLIQITDKTLIWYEMRWDAYAKVSAVKNCFTVGPSNTSYPNMTLNLSTLMWL